MSTLNSDMLNTLIVLDLEAFYVNSLSTIATAAMAEIQLDYNKMPFLKYRNMALKEYTFCNDNI